MRYLVIRTVMLFLLCLAIPAATPAQEKAPKSSGQGYAFVGFGAANGEDALLHFGGGGEANLYKGLGFGVEIGYLSPIRYMSEGIGIFSANGLYTFGAGRTGKVKPFITGGYTLAFRSGTLNAVNFGGGLHYWFSNKVGLRFEFRDHVSPTAGNVHIWQGRVGFAFR